MKILFFHRWVGVHGGGTETHLKELAKRLADSGHKVAILTREGNQLGKFHPAITILRIGRNLAEYDHSYQDLRVYYHTALYIIKSFLKLIILWLKGERFDVISVHFATEAIVARLFRFFTGTPYVFILEGYTAWEAKEAKAANSCVAISKYEAQRCQREFGFSPRVIYIGVDQKRFSPKGEIWPGKDKICPKGQKLILAVCRLEPRKDLSTLLSAAKILENQKISLAIAGTGIDEEKLKVKSKKLKLRNCHFLGFVPDKDLPALYRAADLFVLPTLEEGFGIVLTEAMASGVPVLSNSVGAVPEVVDKAGITIAPQKPKLLAENILKILKDGKLGEKMKEKGLELVKNRYNWDKIIRQYEKVYKNIIKSKAQMSNEIQNPNFTI